MNACVGVVYMWKEREREKASQPNELERSQASKLLKKRNRNRLHLFHKTLATRKYITLHYIALHCTTLHYTTLHYTTLHYTTLHYTAILYYSVLLPSYPTLFHSTLLYSTTSSSHYLPSPSLPSTFPLTLTYSRPRYHTQNQTHYSCHPSPVYVNKLHLGVRKVRESYILNTNLPIYLVTSLNNRKLGESNLGQRDLSIKHPIRPKKRTIIFERKKKKKKKKEI
ncbi:hypothetical protein EYC80_007144 [Monilinia laxa]|uniref:Uncharacterized protein n=1 Tax=Monilinia laxa TaxID=61186 RepID=A0A5N6K0C6_MONLA|nr:hypothetical protein EYC80_007144 [Monilinia laxa]